MQQKSSSKTKKTMTRTFRLTKDSGLSAKPKVVRRAGKREPEQDYSVTEDTRMEREEVGAMASNTDDDPTIHAPVAGKEDEDSPSPATEPQNSTPSPPALPSIAGFDLSGMSLGQQYAVRNAVVLCDCCHQGTPERIFDVLGRNFADTGALMWFLSRIGKGHVAESLKGRDVVDAVRKAAHLLSRELKEEIGKPVRRW